MLSIFKEIIEHFCGTINQYFGSYCNGYDVQHFSDHSVEATSLNSSNATFHIKMIHSHVAGDKKNVLVSDFSWIVEILMCFVCFSFATCTDTNQGQPTLETENNVKPILFHKIYKNTLRQVILSVQSSIDLVSTITNVFIFLSFIR